MPKHSNKLKSVATQLEKHDSSPSHSPIVSKDEIPNPNNKTYYEFLNEKHATFKQLAADHQNIANRLQTIYYVMQTSAFMLSLCVTIIASIVDDDIIIIIFGAMLSLMTGLDTVWELQYSACSHTETKLQYQQLAIETRIILENTDEPIEYKDVMRVLQVLRAIELVEPGLTYRCYCF